MPVWIVAAILVCLLAAGAALLRLACGRRRLPDPWAPAEPAQGIHGPRRDDILAGMEWFRNRRVEQVETTSDDELTLRGVLVPRKNPKGTILFFHDFRSDWKRDFAGAAKFYYGRGYRLLFVDQRAHGRSGGRWSTWGVWERFDVRAWTNYASFRFGDDHPIFLAGAGMGAAAVLMASSLDLPGNMRGILADSAYTSPYDVLEQGVSVRLGLPPLPVLALLNLFTTFFVGVGLREYSAVRAVQETEYPVLLLHGTADRDTPPDMAKRIRDACAGPKFLLLVEGAGHCESRLLAPKQTEDTIAAFLQARLGTEENL